MSSLASIVDTVLDRSVALGYGNIGLEIRKRLPGWPADPPRMDGKVVLVTGAGSGIGLAAAAGFATLGASVRALARTEARADRAAELARRRAGRGDVRPVACELSSRAELRKFIDRFTEQEARLDVLVNNAGVMPEEREHSVDGVELMFATHLLAPWMLIDGLSPLLRRGAPSRVINVSSGGQYGGHIPVGDLQSEHSDYGPKKLYARTKREQLVLTEQWARRLAGTGVHVHAMHPGWADTSGVRNWMPVFRAVTLPILRTPEQGADTIVWLGAASEAIESTGLFWQDRRPRPTTHPIGSGPDDARAREELWEHVAQLAGTPS